MISRVIRKFGLMAAALLVAAGARAQSTPLDWSLICYDGTSTSSDYILYDIGTPMFAAQMAISGTAVSLGGDTSFGKCFTITTSLWGDTVASHAATPSGSLTFTAGDPFSSFSGEVGSVQTTRDDYMLTSFGAPEFVGQPWSYSELVVDSPSTHTPIPAFATYFIGESDRYMYAEVTGVSNFTVNVRVDMIGDAARVQWRLINTDTNPHTVGLWSGQWSAMMAQPETKGGLPPTSGFSPLYAPTYPGSFKNLYVTMPHNLPPIVEHRYNRDLDPANFPDYVNLMFSQNLPYGLRVENGPLDDNIFDTLVHGGVHDGETIDSAGADEFVFGSSGMLLNGPSGAAPMKDATYPEVFPGAGYSDIDPRMDAGYIQKWNDTGHTVQPGDERIIVQYYRSTWSNADYRLPYATVVDAPKMFQPTVGNPSVLSPNPAKVRVYVDNTSGYSKIITGVPINNVRITMRVPKSTGISFDPSDSPQE